MASYLSVFNFDIEYIKGSQNTIPDFFTREFLQCHNGKYVVERLEPCHE